MPPKLSSKKQTKTLNQPPIHPLIYVTLVITVVLLSNSFYRLIQENRQVKADFVQSFE